MDLELVHVPQDVLIELAPERFGGLIDNFGHTQVYDGSKLRALIPEFQPIFSLVSAIRDSISWMDSHNLIPESEDWGVEDRIIDIMRKLPGIFRNTEP